MRITCPCGKALLVKDTLAGKRLNCPSCGQAITVPEAQPEAAATGAKPAPPPAPVEEDSPKDSQRKTGSAKRKALSPVVLILAGGAALLVLAVGAALVVMFLFPSAPTALVRQSSFQPPAGMPGPDGPSSPPPGDGPGGPMVPPNPGNLNPPAMDQPGTPALELRRVDISQVAYSPEGSMLATLTSYLEAWNVVMGKLVIWDRAKERVKVMLEDTGVTSYKYLCFSPNGQMLAAINAEKEKLWLWDVKTGKLIRSYPSAVKWNAKIQFLEFTPDNQFLVFFAKYPEENKVCKVRTADDHVEDVAGLDLKTITFDDSGNVAYCPAKDLLVADFTDDRAEPAKHFLQVSHVLRPGAPQNVPVAGSVHAKALSGDGKTLAFAYGGNEEARHGIIEVWDTATWKPRTVLKSEGSGPKPYYGSILASADGSHLVTTSYFTSGAIVREAWDVAAKKSLKLPYFTLLEVTLSPDGKTLAFPSLSRAKFVDITTGRDKGP